MSNDRLRVSQVAMIEVQSVIGRLEKMARCDIFRTFPFFVKQLTATEQEIGVSIMNQFLIITVLQTQNYCEQFNVKKYILYINK